MNRAREAFTRAAAASLGYAAGLLVIAVVDWSVHAWLDERADRKNEGQAVLNDHADETETTR